MLSIALPILSTTLPPIKYTASSQLQHLFSDTLPSLNHTASSATVSGFNWTLSLVSLSTGLGSQLDIDLWTLSLISGPYVLYVDLISYLWTARLREVASALQLALEWHLDFTITMTIMILAAWLHVDRSLAFLMPGQVFDLQSTYKVCLLG